MRVPLEQQREAYRLHAHAATDRLLARLAERRAELVTLGMTRAFDTVGVHEYGDSTYHRSPAELGDETDAELADAIFYAHIELAREAGDLPRPA